MTIRSIPYGYVYCITNILNGKTYIGQRKLSKDRFWREYLGSGSAIKSAVNKYGKENFIKGFIGYSENEAELFELEWLWIQKYKSQGKAEYNIFNGKVAGGNTFVRNSPEKQAEIRKTMSRGLRKIFDSGEYSTWNKGKSKETDERLMQKSVRAKELGTYKGKNLGYKHSEEAIEKIRIAQIGNKNGGTWVRDEDFRKQLAFTIKSRSICKSGETSLELHDRLLIDFPRAKKSNLKKPEILKSLNISNGTYHKFSCSHGFNPNIKICFICESRKEES